MKKYILPILSILLLLGTLPFCDLGFIAWFALVPLLLFLYNKSTKNFEAALVSGMVFFLYILGVLWPLTTVNVWWWSNPSLYTHRYFFIILIVLITSIYSGGVFGAFFGWWGKKNNNPFLLGIIWSILELIRLPFVSQFEWGILGYTQHSYPQIISIVHLIGPIGLSGLIVLTNGCLALFLLKKDKKYFFITGAIFITLFTYGYFQENDLPNNSRTILVSSLHVEKEIKDFYSEDVVTDTINLIKQELHKKPDIIVLPENIFPFLIFGDNSFPISYTTSPLVSRTFDTLIDISIQYPDTTILLGAHHQRKGNLFNTIQQLSGGVLVDTYQKNRLMPFGEKNFLFLQNQTGKMTNGKDHVLTIHDIHIKPLVCSEIIQPFNTHNSSIIIQVGNEEIFDSPLVAKENMIISKVKAIQHKIFIIRSTKGGGTSIISSSGKILTKETISTEFISHNISIPQ